MLAPFKPTVKSSKWKTTAALDVKDPAFIALNNFLARLVLQSDFETFERLGVLLMRAAFENENSDEAAFLPSIRPWLTIAGVRLEQSEYLHQQQVKPGKRLLEQLSKDDSYTPEILARCRYEWWQNRLVTLEGSRQG